MSQPKVPITRPYIPAEALDLVQEPLKTGWLTQGPQVAAFQEAIARVSGTRFAVATSSCTTALFVTLAALGLKPGDEVITTPYSHISTANVIVHLGARPVFVDIDLETYNLDPDLIEAAVTERTAGLLPVHQVGLPADLDRIREAAGRRGLFVLEDAACALGSFYKGRPVGGGSSAACFSFHPRKLLTTGEGGMVVTDDEALAGRVAMLVSHGSSVAEEVRHASTRHLNPRFTAVGYNFRMSDLQAAVGLAQVPTLEWHIRERTRLAGRYTEAFEADGRIRCPRTPDWATPNYQSYLIRVPGLSQDQRDRVIDRLREEGVAANPGVTGIPFEPAYAERAGGLDLPRCREALATTLILPLFPQMSLADQDRVIEGLLKALGEAV